MSPLQRATLYILVVVSAGLLVGARCGPAREREADEREDFALTCSDGSACGTFRWGVKVTADSANTQIVSTPVDFTIPQLLNLAMPSNLQIQTPRFTGSPYDIELKVVRLRNVLLQRFKLEADSDFHLMISDPSDPGATSLTMVSEISKPCCIYAGSPFAANMTSARNDFLARYTPTDTYTTLTPPQPISLLGVGLYDMPNHGTGGAANGIELHPIIAICFGQDCSLPVEVGSADAGTPDAGSPDAGSPDAGPTGPPTQRKSGCGSFPEAGWLAAFVALWVRGRRRPKEVGMTYRLN